MLPSDKTSVPAAPKATEKLSRLRQRQKLIDACISALYLHGPSRTTIDKVVAIADMSPGIVNFYFETKAALLVATLEYLAEEFEDRVLAPLSALRGDPAHALRRLIELYLDADIASPRKVSVWYAFWGEANSRSEYYAICGKRDEAFADLVRDLIGRLIRQSCAPHLDADAVALGLIGALEMIWQEIAFHDEADVDRQSARARCLAYLGSVFPAQFGAAGTVAITAPAAPDQAPRAVALLLVAEFALAGIPAVTTASFAPGCDIVAQLPGAPPQRIAVRDGTETCPVEFTSADQFDWLALAFLSTQSSLARRFFVVPRAVVLEFAANLQNSATNRYRCDIETAGRLFAAFEGNFTLR